MGLNGKPAATWSYELSGTWSRSDGEADFTAFPGGLPLGNPPRQVVDFGNANVGDYTANMFGLELSLTF